MKIVRGTGAIKKGFMQLEGSRFLLQGPRFPYRAIGSFQKPSVPVTGFLSCLIGPWFKNIGLDRTKGSFLVPDPPIAHQYVVQPDSQTCKQTFPT